MSCGHPVECIVSGDEGTAYCRWCALQAENARLTEESVSTVDLLSVMATANAELREQLEAARESRKRLVLLQRSGFWGRMTARVQRQRDELKEELAQERARCARIADAVAADFCADPDLPSGCQAARTIADAIRSGEAA